MIKILQLILLNQLITYSIFAQLPNAGFENWTDELFYSEPTDYQTSNMASLIFGSPINVKKSTDKNSGNYAIRLETTSFTGWKEKDTIPGLAMTGDILDLFISKTLVGGFPFNNRPNKFSGYYKHSSEKFNEFIIGILLFKYNPSKTGRRDTIGGAYFSSADNKDKYTKFEVDFIYGSSVSFPDSAMIILSSSLPDKPVNGSVLFVDDLIVEGGVTSINSGLSATISNAFPNPASDYLTISNIDDKATKIEIKDALGRVVENNVITQKIDYYLATSNYNSGFYTYQLFDSKGLILQIGKFNVR